MHRYFLASVMTWSLLLSGPLPSQTTPFQIVRDPQAESILARSHAAMGGLAAKGISDVRITGELLLQQAQSIASGTITFEFQAPDKIRTEVTINGETDISIVNARRSLSVRGGVSKRAPLQVTANRRPEMLPAFTEVSDWMNPNSSLAYVGMVDIDGKPAHQIRVSQPPQGKTEPAIEMAQITAVDLYIDAASYLLVKRSRQVPGTEHYKNTIQEDVAYSDYRTAGKLVVPYSITYFIRQQKFAVVTVTSVTSNSGISPAKFEVR